MIVSLSRIFTGVAIGFIPVVGFSTLIGGSL